ncbi:MAG: DUF3631 domain-containing protein [Tepidiformaceae bacterium]
MKLDDMDIVIDGAGLLDEVYAADARFVVLPSESARVALTLWTAATHAQQCWEHATRFVLKSPLKRCGKTRGLEVTSELVYRALPSSNISVAALVHGIDAQDPPTLILDEADAIFAKRRGDHSETAEALRGIINTGFGKGFSYVRYDIASRSNISSSTFCMAIVASIGDLPDTIEDRAVVVTMQRRAPGERVSEFRRRKALPVLHELRTRLHAWAVSHAPELLIAEPEVPAQDRAHDVWEPLIAIADAAGGEWQERARRACLELTASASDPDDGTSGERLLSDLYQVFAERARMTTAQILIGLHAIEEAPWGDWKNGHSLKARDLAWLLRPYQIKSHNIRAGGAVARGYERHDFAPAWTRYTHASATSATPATDSLAGGDSESENPVADDDEGIRYTSATAHSESENRAKTGSVAAVADVARGHAGDVSGDGAGSESPAPDPSWCDANGCLQIVRPDRPCPDHRVQGTRASASPEGVREW